jgi:hypothetical protein
MSTNDVRHPRAISHSTTTRVDPDFNLLAQIASQFRVDEQWG